MEEKVVQWPEETAESIDLKGLLDFKIPMARKKDYAATFAKIASAFLNHTVLECHNSSSYATSSSASSP